MILAAILLDIAHQTGLPTPGMVDHELCINAEHFVQQVGIGTMADKYYLSYNAMKYRIKNAILVFEKKYGNTW